MSATPLRVAVVGALGRMGERVRAALATADDAVLVGALEAVDHPELGRDLDGVTLCADPRRALGNADVAIDFSTPAASRAALAAAAERGLAYVCGTTGFGATERRDLAAYAAKSPLVLAANFSATVHTLFHLLGEALRRLGDDVDVEILELHHGAKGDAPSGTALRLAEIAAAALPPSASPAPTVTSRSGATGPRPRGAIGIQALRGGDNPGEHTVLLLGHGERLELTHRAATRDHFARGALRVAHWLRHRPPGLYTVEQALAARGDA